MFIFSLLFHFVSYDIWFYISHVLLHSPYLYKYHKQHHTKIVPTFLDTYLGHVIEGPFQSIGTFFPFVMGLKYSYYDVILILVLLNTRGMMRHDERCVFLIGNHHLLHHRYPKYNFGEYWIDSICGTRYKNNEYKRGLLYY